MPKFKGKDGKVIEVSEDRANEVFRQQRQWIEVKDEEKPKKAGRPRKVS